jgi:hypothetical protein
MPTSPGATDEWAPLPAQGSSYAGKGVTMPDVPPKWDLGYLGALTQEQESIIDEQRAILIGKGAIGLVLNPLWIWFLWRALKHEKALFFKVFAWLALIGSSLGILGSITAIIIGAALKDDDFKRQEYWAALTSGARAPAIAKAVPAGNPISMAINGI